MRTGGLLVAGLWFRPHFKQKPVSIAGGILWKCKVRLRPERRFHLLFGPEIDPEPNAKKEKGENRKGDEYFKEFFHGINSS
jgi:hypothetical protein